jgi:hypothetical protein
VPSTFHQVSSSIHPAFIAGIAWNMVNSRLRKRSGYDTSGWLSSEGKMNDEMFLEEVDIALGHV